MFSFEYLALISSLIMAALELVLRALQRERDQSWFLSALGSWSGGLVLLPFIPYRYLDLSPTTIILLITAGSFWAVSVYADFKSLVTLPVGVGALMSGLRTVLLVAIEAIFFGESFTIQDSVGVTLAIAGVLIACAWKAGGSLTGAGPRLLAVIMSGAAIVTEKALAQRTAIELIIAGGYFIPGAVYLILKPSDWRKQCALGPPRRTALIGLYVLLYAAVGPVFVTSFALGNLGEAFVIFQSRLALTMIFGALILGEREGLLWKCTGMATTLCGLYLLLQ